MTLRSYLPLTLSVLSIFTAINRLPAQVVAYDPFMQNTGQLNGFASSGGGAVWPSSAVWSPYSGNGGVVVSGSLNYGPLQTAGNRVQMSWFAPDNASTRPLGSNRGGAPANFWLSFLGNLTQANQGLFLSSGPGAERMLIGATASGNLGMDLAGSVTGTGAQTLAVNPALTANGTTHFFAAHFQLGQAGFNNSITLYADPDPGSLGTGLAPTGGSTATFGTAVNFAFDNVVIGNRSGVMGPAGAFTLDEIRIGSTWASVSPVPEPSGLLLSAAGAASAYWRARLRAKSPKSVP